MATHLDAAFALEAALAGLARTDVDTQRASHQWLVDEATLVGHPLGAGEVECGWYWTASAGLAGRIDAGTRVDILQRGIGRCPSEARLHLAYTRGDEISAGRSARRVRAMGKPPLTSPTDDHVRNVWDRYRRAMAFPDTALESVRLAWFLLRLNRANEAHDVLSAAGPQSPDLYHRYLDQLIRGKVLQALGRFDEAATALESALTTRPQAQSARVALMHVELARNRRPASAMLADAIQTAPVEPTVTDPWWLYWQGDYRASCTIIANLRDRTDDPAVRRGRPLVRPGWYLALTIALVAQIRAGQTPAAQTVRFRSAAARTPSSSPPLLNAGAGRSRG